MGKKTTMGKDREGNYIPPKGKPSGDGQPKSGGQRPVNHLDNLEERDRIADTYTDGPDQPASNVHIRHPNRNPNKDDDGELDKPAYGGGH